MFNGDYVQSVAASAKAILAVTRNASGGDPTIHRIDLLTRSSTRLPSLGVYQNKVALNSVMTAAPNGASILLASADGTVFLYDANTDSFTVSRKDFTALSGAYAASDFNQYVVGNNLLNASLVSTAQFEAGTGSSSGFAFVDQFAFRTTVPGGAAASSAAGVIQRMDLGNSNANVSRATRIVEAPLLGATNAAFTRTLAPLYSRTSILNLTVSGFTVLPWNYDSSVPAPHIDKIVNAADLTTFIAPGGLISLFGSQLSPVNIATNEIPLPTALADSCLSVNGLPVPILFVSPSQINAQMPFESLGHVTMILRTPGGVSDNYNLTITPGAPSVFRAQVQQSSVPTIVRVKNNQLVTQSNPVHKNDTLTIYLTGLGQTTPAVETGMPSPTRPLATALNAPTVVLGWTTLPILYAGLTPGEVGVYQINVKIPTSVEKGSAVTLTITQAGVSTTMAVRVVDE